MWLSLPPHRRTFVQAIIGGALVVHALGILPLSVSAVENEITYIGTQTHIYGDDGHGGGQKGPFPIGFPFTFYDTQFTQAHININGVLTFGAYYTAFTNSALNAGGQDNSIFAFWDDLITSIAMDSSVKPIYYATIGAEPNRTFVVQWTNMYFYGTDIQMGTFQVLLYEGSNDVQIQYRDLLGGDRALGNSATIGIKKNNETYAQYSANTVSLTEGQAIRYSFNNGAGYTVNTAATYDPVYLAPEGAPASPVLVNPTDGTTGITTTPTFEWLPVDGAQTYTVLISLLSNFSTTVANVGGLTGTSYTHNSALSTDTTYYWRVQAINANGSSLSAARSFVTGGANAAPDSPTNVSSAALLGGVAVMDASGSSLTAVLSDADATDQLRLRVQIATDAAFHSLVIDYRSPFQAQGSATFTIGETAGTYLVGNGGTELGLTSYYVRLRAEDEAAASSAWYTEDGIAFTVTGDITAPIIAGVSASPEEQSAAVLWTTDEPASSRLLYGTTAALGNTTTETQTNPRGTSHTVTLHSLPMCTTYFFRPLSRDAAGNTGTGALAQFTTKGCVNEAPITVQTGSLFATDGGLLSMTSNGSGARLEVPANATGHAFTLQIKQLEKDTVLAATSTPSGAAVIGNHTYDFRAISGSTIVTHFSEAITVTMVYTDDQVNGYEESSLWIHRWDGSAWAALDACVVDTAINTVTCTTRHFSTFGLFGEARTPAAPVSYDPVSPVRSGGPRGQVSSAFLLPAPSVEHFDSPCPFSSRLLCGVRARLVDRIAAHRTLMPRLAAHLERVLTRWDQRSRRLPTH